jgi:hypothetical protein
MRFPALILGLLMTGGPIAPSAAANNYACNGDRTTCINECVAAGLSLDVCVRSLRRHQRTPPVVSVPVQPNTRSKYRPVPQGGSGSQQPGPYVNPQ